MDDEDEIVGLTNDIQIRVGHLETHIIALQFENERLQAYLRLCHRDIDPACPFEKWIEHLEWIRQREADDE